MIGSYSLIGNSEFMQGMEVKEQAGRKKGRMRRRGIGGD